MAHWAEIDKNNIVLRVTVGDNNETDEGYQWLVDNIGGTWIKTSYNSYAGVHYTTDEEGNKIASGKSHLRYNYAGVGFTYDPVNDAFIPPKPDNEETWFLNEETFIWEIY
jgi:hypothetical protein